MSRNADAAGMMEGGDEEMGGGGEDMTAAVLWGRRLHCRVIIGAGDDETQAESHNL